MICGTHTSVGDEGASITVATILQDNGCEGSSVKLLEKTGVFELRGNVARARRVVD